MRLARTCCPAGRCLDIFVKFIHRHSKFLLNHSKHDIHGLRRCHVLKLFEMTSVRLWSYLWPLSIVSECRANHSQVQANVVQCARFITDRRQILSNFDKYAAEVDEDIENLRGTLLVLNTVYVVRNVKFRAAKFQS